MTKDGSRYEVSAKARSQTKAPLVDQAFYRIIEEGNEYIDVTTTVNSLIRRNGWFNFTAGKTLHECFKDPSIDAWKILVVKKGSKKIDIFEDGYALAMQDSFSQVYDLSVLNVSEASTDFWHSHAKNNAQVHPTVITEAVYRSTKDGSIYKDVTVAVRQLIGQHGWFNFTAGRSLHACFGDASTHDGKMLRVRLGSKTVDIFEENFANVTGRSAPLAYDVSILKPADPPKDVHEVHPRELGVPHTATERPQLIEKALYRSTKDGSKYKDVTVTVNQLVRQHGWFNFTSGKSLHACFSDLSMDDDGGKMLRVKRGSKMVDFFEDDYVVSKKDPVPIAYDLSNLRPAGIPINSTNRIVRHNIAREDAADEPSELQPIGPIDGLYQAITNILTSSWSDVLD